MTKSRGLNRPRFPGNPILTLFDRTTLPLDLDQCWDWTGSKVRGYGIFMWRGRNIAAHRFAFELLRGPVPDGLDLDHLCRRRHCVNPWHLEPVTRRVNLLRGDTIVARQAAQTHCKHDHPLSGDNLYMEPGTNKRHCRECRSRIDRERAPKRRLQRLRLKYPQSAD